MVIARDGRRAQELCDLLTGRNATGNYKVDSIGWAADIQQVERVVSFIPAELPTAKPLPDGRADRLFEALRKLCGAENKNEAVALLVMSRAMLGNEQAAGDAVEALDVLVKEWLE